MFYSYTISYLVLNINDIQPGSALVLRSRCRVKTGARHAGAVAGDLSAHALWPNEWAAVIYTGIHP